MKKIYHYIYYIMYFDISKSNKFSPENSTSRYLSLCFILNIMTIFFFSEKLFNESGYIYFMMSGLTISFLNGNYFDHKKHKLIIWEFKNNTISKFWNYLILLYPLFSFILLSISFESSWTTVFIIIGGFVIFRSIKYFSEL